MVKFKSAASLRIHWLNSVRSKAVVFLPVSQTEGASGRDLHFGSLKFAKQFGHQGYIVEPFLLMWLQRPMAEQSIVRQLERCPTHNTHLHTYTCKCTHTHYFHQLSLKLHCPTNPHLVKGGAYLHYAKIKCDLFYCCNWKINNNEKNYNLSN